MSMFIQSLPGESLQAFCTRCEAGAAVLGEHDTFEAEFEGLSIIVEPHDRKDAICGRWTVAKYQDNLEKDLNMKTVTDKHYTRGVCRLTLTGGQFITAVGRYAEVLDQFDIGAKLCISGRSKENNRMDLDMGSLGVPKNGGAWT